MKRSRVELEAAIATAHQSLQEMQQELREMTVYEKVFVEMSEKEKVKFEEDKNEITNLIHSASIFKNELTTERKSVFIRKWLVAQGFFVDCITIKESCICVPKKQCSCSLTEKKVWNITW